MKRAIVIGSGFAGISAASFLAKGGWDVTVIEKHDQPGGRARRLNANGFSFDMGPSWYWMPDIFERYFNQFGKKTTDYYKLTRLDPSYRIYWPSDVWDIPANYESLKDLFEKIEPGAGNELDKVMVEAAYKYDVGINKIVFKPGQSWREFLDMDLIKGVFKLDVFQSIKSHFSKHFHNPQIREMMEFPVLFLGALPEKTPALYSLMNYADIKGGTWFPEGGMYSVVTGMYKLACELGVKFLFGTEVKSMMVQHKKVVGVLAAKDDKTNLHETDIVISGADYHHTEIDLLVEENRTYTPKYWHERVFAPSCLLYYVGIDKKIEGLQHHSLFFDVPFAPHAKDIYTTPQWPDEPLFYVSATSVTDATQAPEGCENLFFLIPVASGLDGDTEELRDEYFSKILARFEKRIGQTIIDNIVFYKSYAQQNFIEDYHAFKGNAYGLANTLMQTAILKPSCKSKKLDNLFFTGQLTVPGPGVPPSLISGEIVATLINKSQL